MLSAINCRLTFRFLRLRQFNELVHTLDQAGASCGLSKSLAEMAVSNSGGIRSNEGDLQGKGTNVRLVKCHKRLAGFTSNRVAAGPQWPERDDGYAITEQTRFAAGRRAAPLDGHRLYDAPLRCFRPQH